MQQDELESVRSFLKKCVEIGNTPLFDQKKFIREIAKRRTLRKIQDRKSRRLQHTQGENFELVGTINKISGARFIIENHEIVVDGDTWVLGHPAVGKQIEVQGTLTPEGKRIARKVRVR